MRCKIEKFSATAALVFCRYLLTLASFMHTNSTPPARRHLHRPLRYLTALPHWAHSTRADAIPAGRRNAIHSKRDYSLTIANGPHAEDSRRA
ncbi:hypothetical protein DFH09DRAFT_1128070 [Mycena vulgaris]|nr:hypothetical protein DFH09DRAFT_1128070 [Mycena vulgaris]